MKSEIPAGEAADKSAEGAAAGDAANDMDRARRMAVMAHAETAELINRWKKLDLDPEFEMVRGPEQGLVALRGRIGGGGAPFNFGEATATRATVKLANGNVGHAMTLGRSDVKAKLAAVIDALALDAENAEAIETTIIAPLEAEDFRHRTLRREQTEATRVDFFTMVRGED